MLYGNENVKEAMGMTVDWNDVLKKVADKRAESMEYLINALKNGETK
jgi:hypothetical protein